MLICSPIPMKFQSNFMGEKYLLFLWCCSTGSIQFTRNNVHNKFIVKIEDLYFGSVENFMLYFISILIQRKKKKYIHSMNKYKGKNGFGDRLNYMRLRSDFFFCVWIVHKINVWKKYFMLKLVFYLISFVELISCQNEVFDPFKCSQSLITTKCGAQGNWWKFKSSSLQRTA